MIKERETNMPSSKKIISRKLVILGNGFDLNLGMKSRFSDFAASNYGKEVLQQNRWKNPRPYWYNFEENMAQNYTSALLKRVRAEKERVKSSHLYEFGYYLKQYRNISEKLTEYLEAAQDDVLNAQNEISSRNDANPFKHSPTIPEVMLETDKKLKEADAILSFNYTQTPQEIFGISDERVIYIHGSLKDNNIILGANNDVNFQGEINDFTPLRKAFRRDVNDFIQRQKPDSDVLNEFKKFDMQFYNYRNLPTEFYKAKILPEVLELDENYEMISKYFVDDQLLNFGEQNWDRAMKIKEKWKINSKLAPQIIDYVSNNLFRPFKIDVGIGIHSLNEIEEISIMGHSLNSDIEVIEDLLHSCLKLKKVNIFYYNGESITEKMRKVEFVLKNVYFSDVNINLVRYWAK